MKRFLTLVLAMVCLIGCERPSSEGQGTVPVYARPKGRFLQTSAVVLSAPPQLRVPNKPFLLEAAPALGFQVVDVERELEIGAAILNQSQIQTILSNGGQGPVTPFVSLPLLPNGSFNATVFTVPPVAEGEMILFFIHEIGNPDALIVLGRSTDPIYALAAAVHGFSSTNGGATTSVTAVPFFLP